MTTVLTSIAAVFVLAAAALVLVHRYDLPVFPVYIGAGVIVGMFTDTVRVTPIAQLGLVFLLFFVGLRTDIQRFPRDVSRIVYLSVARILVVFTAVGLVAWIAGIAAVEAVVVGMAAALSSTLAGRDTVQTELRHNLLYSRIAETVNVVQDTVAVILLAVLAGYPDLNAAALYGTVAAGTLLAAGLLRPVIVRGVNRVTGRRPELLLLTGITGLLGAITAVQHIGIPAAVGAYAAGLAVSRASENMELTEALDPLEDFFVVFLFVLIGSLLELPSMPVIWIAGLILLCSAIGIPVLVFGSLRWAGYDSRTAYLAALRLDQVSEFALAGVLIGAGTATVSPIVVQGVLLAFAVSLLTSAVTTRYADMIYEPIFRWIGVHESTHALEHTHLVDDLDGHIIVAGYGNTGRALVDALDGVDRPIVTVDYDAVASRHANEAGINHVFGDLRHASTWRRVHAEDAALIVSTVPDQTIRRQIEALDTAADAILLVEDGHYSATAADVTVLRRDRLTAQAVTDIIRRYLSSSAAAEAASDGADRSATSG